MKTVEQVLREHYFTAETRVLPAIYKAMEAYAEEVIKDRFPTHDEMNEHANKEFPVNGDMDTTRVRLGYKMSYGWYKKRMKISD